MKSALQDEEMEAMLIPKWDVGCQRLAPDTGYLAVSDPRLDLNPCFCRSLAAECEEA
jgi:hypothetical protein